MKPSLHVLALSIVFSGCIRSPRSPEVPNEDNPSVQFPAFFEREAITVGAENTLYEMDGEVLRAVLIATRDLLGSSTEELLGSSSAQPCRNRMEAQSYRVLREGNVIFVYIYENHSYCGRPYPAPDSGAKYAITTDGRLLRRVIDGQLMGPVVPAPLESNDAGPPIELGRSRTFDAIWNAPGVMQQDGGPLAPPSDGGVPTPEPRGEAR